ncbi:MAG: gamma carbonic anhydrase family protein [Nitrososphaerales archaeon]
MTTILALGEKLPKIHPTAVLLDGSVISGDVELGAKVGVWYNAVIRGDESPIRIGKNTNIQDACVIHSDSGLVAEIGDNVTLGHGVIVHGCKISSNCLIGMGSVLLNKCEIGEWSLIGANSLVTMGTKIPPRSLVMGSPAKVKRQLTKKEIQSISDNATTYLRFASEHKERRVVVSGQS